MILESVDEIRAPDEKAPSDWMQLHIAAEVAAIDATPEPKAQPLDVSRWQLSPWAKWVAADEDGVVYMYENCPTTYNNGMWGLWRATGISTRCGCIDLAGIDWRLTLTPVNQEQPAQPWCTDCNLPEDICRGCYDTVPSPTVETIVPLWQPLTAQHGEAMAKRLAISDDEHLHRWGRPPVNVLAWQLAQLSPDDVSTLARQLAHADTSRANLLAEALWSEAMDVEHAALQADDKAIEESNERAVWGDAVPVLQPLPDYAEGLRQWVADVVAQPDPRLIMTVVAGTTDDDEYMAQAAMAQ